jgi:hypothetical protein
MRRPILLTLILCFSIAAAPTTRPSRPTTRPTAKPPARVRDAINKGTLRFLVPADWELVERGADDLSVKYKLPGGDSEVSINVKPQQSFVPNNHPGLRKQLADFVLRGSADELKQRNAEVLDAPKLINDAAFMVKMHERFRDGHDEVDAVRLYRGVSWNIVDVMSSAIKAEPDQAKAQHDAAALMLLSVTSGPEDPKLTRQVKKE